MSIKAAQNFLNRVKTDQSFANQFRALSTGDERYNFVFMAGFNCTREEIIKAVDDVELSETELEKITGGGILTSGDGSCPDCYWW